MLSRKRNALAIYEEHHGPNMTPMVDVVMVILIFFMASAAMLGPEWFLNSRVAKPDGAAIASETKRTRYEVVLAMSGSSVAATVNGQTVDVDTLIDRIGASVKSDGADAVVVVVIPDADVPYDAVVRIHEACAELGVTAVGIGTRGGAESESRK